MTRTVRDIFLGAILVTLAFVVVNVVGDDQRDRIDRNSYGACIASGSQICERPPGAPSLSPAPTGLPTLPTPTNTGP